MKVIIRLSGTKNQYHDINVDIDGTEHYVGFIVDKGSKRYGFIPLESKLGQLKDVGQTLYRDSGLTLTEAKALAHVLAGIYLAAKALDEEVSALTAEMLKDNKTGDQK